MLYVNKHLKTSVPVVTLNEVKLPQVGFWSFSWILGYCLNKGEDVAGRGCLCQMLTWTQILITDALISIYLDYCNMLYLGYLQYLEKLLVPLGGANQLHGISKITFIEIDIITEFSNLMVLYVFLSKLGRCLSAGYECYLAVLDFKMFQILLLRTQFLHISIKLIFLILYRSCNGPRCADDESVLLL